MSLVQHADISFVYCAAIHKSFGKSIAKGRMSDANLLFLNFAVRVTELKNTLHPGRRAEGNTELSLLFQGSVLAFIYANVFRLYDRQITGAEPGLLQFGLMADNQFELHRAFTTRLSASIVSTMCTWLC